VSVHQEVCACAARQISVPAVYAALARLEQKGLICCWLSEPRPERGGRARRHYGLTAEGRRTVARERAVAMRMWRRLAPHGGGR
jgi:DNA-binding PadR family transcriptional regulator